MDKESKIRVAMNLLNRIIPLWKQGLCEIEINEEEEELLRELGENFKEVAYFAPGSMLTGALLDLLDKKTNEKYCISIKEISLKWDKKKWEC